MKNTLSERSVLSMKKKKNHKRIAAIICLALILLSYIALFVVSLTDSSKSGELFQACLIAAVFLPILCWIYIWLYGQIKQKRTIADPDIFQTTERAENKEPQNEAGSKNKKPQDEMDEI